MELALESLSPCFSASSAAERLVVEGGLDGALAVVEVAAHAEHADVVAGWVTICLRWMSETPSAG